MRKRKATPRPGSADNVVRLYSDPVEVEATWPKPKRRRPWFWGIAVGLAGITVGWAVTTHGASLAPYAASLASSGTSLISRLSRGATSIIQSLERSEPVAIAIIPPAPVPPPIPPRPAIDTADVIRRGEAMIADGKILEARALFEKAALSGDPEGALRLGATYDPEFLKKAQSKIPAQPSEAEFWYGVEKKIRKVLDAPE